MDGSSHMAVDPALAPTLAPLGAPAPEAFRRLAALGFRRVQLSAAQPGLRPRDLDGSGRRDLAATLRRREMEPAGLDLWIPPAHFGDPVRVDRAVAAVTETIALAADLGRCPVSLELPEGSDAVEPAVASLRDAALHHGVRLADHAVPPAAREGIGLGIDPVAWLADGADPVEGIAAAGGRLVSARLCDLVRGGLRGPVGGDGGRLDLGAYRAALSMGDARIVVDARQWSDPWEGLRRTAVVWSG